MILNRQHFRPLAFAVCGVLLLLEAFDCVPSSNWSGLFALTAGAFFAFCAALARWRVIELREALQVIAAQVERRDGKDVFQQLEGDLEFWVASEVIAYTAELEPLREATVNQVALHEDAGLSPSTAQQMALAYYLGGLNRLNQYGDQQ